MQFFVRIALLVTMADVVFLNPLSLGRAIYYALCVLLFGLGFIFWVTTWHIGRRRAGGHVDGKILCHQSGSLSSSLDEKRIWGALIVTEQHILFLVRRGSVVETAWCIERVAVVQCLPFVTKRKRGLLFTAEEESRYFYTNGAEPLLTCLKIPQKEKEMPIRAGSRAKEKPLL